MAAAPPHWRQVFTYDVQGQHFGDTVAIKVSASNLARRSVASTRTDTAEATQCNADSANKLVVATPLVGTGTSKAARQVGDVALLAGATMLSALIAITRAAPATVCQHEAPKCHQQDEGKATPNGSVDNANDTTKTNQVPSTTHPASATAALAHPRTQAGPPLSRTLPSVRTDSTNSAQRNAAASTGSSSCCSMERGTWQTATRPRPLTSASHDEPCAYNQRPQ